MACPSTSQCTAVDDFGREVTFNPTAPGTPTPTMVDRQSLEAIACSSPIRCVAVDDVGDGVVSSQATATALA